MPRVYSHAGSSDLFPPVKKNVANDLYNGYNITQISILGSHCPGPKEEVEIPKGLAKCTQHFNATSCKIVGHNVLHTFGHPVQCDMLQHVG